MAPGEVIRLWTLGTHYRHPLDFSESSLRNAKVALDRFYLTLRSLEEVRAEVEGELPAELLAALSDDLNTPQAIAVLHELVTRANKARRPAEKADRKEALAAAGRVLGLLQYDPETYLQGAGARRSQVFHGADAIAHAPADPGTVITNRIDAMRGEIERLIKERAEARRLKDFARADAIRDELQARGIILEDGPSGTTWRRA
jgi:cysteinyl-tRNA synthetase